MGPYCRWCKSIFSFLFFFFTVLGLIHLFLIEDGWCPYTHMKKLASCYFHGGHVIDTKRHNMPPIVQYLCIMRDKIGVWKAPRRVWSHQRHLGWAIGQLGGKKEQTMLYPTPTQRILNQQWVLIAGSTNVTGHKGLCSWCPYSLQTQLSKCSHKVVNLECFESSHIVFYSFGYTLKTKYRLMETSRLPATDHYIITQCP